MYNKKEIAAYQSIKAPADLRDKVLSACEECSYQRPWYIGRPMKLAVSMAALFLFCFMGIGLWQNNQNGLSIQASGPVSSDGTVQIAAEDHAGHNPDFARYTMEQESISVTLELDISSSAEVLISGGEAKLQNTSSPTTLTAENSCQVTKDCTFLWTVSTERTDYEMTICCKDTIYHIPLTYDKESDSWIIRCQKEEN